VELAIWQCEIHNLTKHFSILAMWTWQTGNVQLAKKKNKKNQLGKINGAFGIP
jgi:hypothetical protein